MRAKMKRPKGPDMHQAIDYGKALPIDYGTPERHQHDDALEPDPKHGGAVRVSTECIIDRYWTRMQINEPQWKAGIELRKLWMRAVHPAAVTSSYGETRGNGGGVGTGIDARQRLRKALEGAGLARHYYNDGRSLALTEAGMTIWMERYPSVLLPAGQVAIAVCGLDEWAGGAKRLHMLRCGLTELAMFWKFT